MKTLMVVILMCATAVVMANEPMGYGGSSSSSSSSQQQVISSWETVLPATIVAQNKMAWLNQRDLKVYSVQRSRSGDQIDYIPAGKAFDTLRPSGQGLKIFSGKFPCGNPVKFIEAQVFRPIWQKSCQNTNTVVEKQCPQAPPININNYLPAAPAPLQVFGAAQLGGQTGSSTVQSNLLAATAVPRQKPDIICIDVKNINKTAVAVAVSNGLVANGGTVTTGAGATAQN